MKGWVSFIGYGARIFSLRASTVSIPTLSSRTCAQIRFARMYRISIKNYLIVLKIFGRNSSLNTYLVALFEPKESQ